MPKLVWRVKLVAELQAGVTTETEVARLERGEEAGLADLVSVESAGTGDWHLGEPMDRGARAELARRGYDGSAHRARQIDAHVSLAAADPALAGKLTANFDEDLGNSHRETLQEWENRPYWEHGMEWLGWLIAREQ